MSDWANSGVRNDNPGLAQAAKALLALHYPDPLLEPGSEEWYEQRQLAEVGAYMTAHHYMCFRIANIKQ